MTHTDSIRRGYVAAPHRKIPLRPTADAPLSPVQRAVWVADRIGADGAYNVSHLMWLRGWLDVEALHRSLDEVARRHEILRTTFVDAPEPRQIVHEARPVELRHVDLTDQPANERATAALRWADEYASRRFDLANGPLFRVALVRTAPDEHLLLLGLHHLLTDEWGVSILVREVSTLYQAHKAGVEPVLPVLPIQYGDYAHWRAVRAEEDPPAGQLAYWRRELGQVAHILELPTDRPRPARPSHRGLRARWSLTPQQSAEFRKLAARYGVSPFTVMLALYAIMLSRHAGQERFAIGTAVSGRTRTETEHLIGLFANLIAIPVGVPADATIAEVVRNTHRSLLGALDNQDVTFEQVVADLKIERSLSRTPVYQAIAHWSEGSGESWQLTDLATEPADLPYGSAKADVAIVGTNMPDVIEFELVCEADLFHADTVQRMMDHFASTVRHALDDPTGPVAGIDLLGPEERGLVLGAWTGAVGEYRSQATLPELFDETATTYPDHTAVVDDTTELTYTQLFTRANQLAHLLRSHGVGTDTIVGLAIPRSTQLAVAILAIVKAGGAYLSLDPTNPPDRNRLLINDSHLTTILATTTSTTNLTPAADHCTIITLDDPTTAATIANQPTEPPPITATPLSLAQICYTSGSTGKPKGVGIQHRNIIRLTHQPTYTTYGPTETFIQLAPIAFDVSAFEIWTSLLNGSTLVMPPPGKLDVPDIAALLRRYQVTTVVLVTALFHQVVEQDLACLAGIRNLVLGGDVALPDAVASLLRAHPNLALRACYGPTENTTITTAITITDPDTIGTRVPIGHPINHTTTYILDHNLQPVPIGVTGELYTGGDGITRGYLNHPAATAERYLPDPYSPTPGARMYRTGDYARWRPNGTIDFLGRTDNQVKIRGFRIELGEIEARLTQHPNISEAVVLAQPDHTGHKRLIAYIVPTNPNQPPTTTDIRHFIQQALPDYMTPATTIPLTHIPLNNNGKVDRKALPTTPTITQPTTTNHHLTPTERTLTTIWQKTLGLTTINPTDNFFDLGGDSILSIRIASEARQHNINITSTDLFDHQTITQLAATADKRAATSGEAGGSTPATTPAGDVPLTPIQKLFIERQQVHHHYNQSLRLAWHPSPDPDLLLDALDALVRHHDALRLRLTEHNGTWHQHIAGPEPTDLLTVIDLPAGPGSDHEDAILAAATEAQTSLDISAGPLLRAVLVRTHGTGDQLILVVHHLAIDTVSWPILLDDLATAYRQLAAGRTVRLPARTTPFRLWAQRLAEYAASDGFAAEAEFWREYDQAEATPLPVDRPVGINTVGEAGTVTAVLEQRETESLLRTVPAAYQTQIGEVLLTALGRTLYDWTGHGRHRVDVEGHGREPVLPDLDISRTVGWFTTLYPVVLNLPEADDPGACLVAVRNELRRIPNRRIGYGMARYLRPDDGRPWRSGGDSPLLFNYHGQIMDAGDGNPRRLRANCGPEIDPSVKRHYLIELTAAVVEGRLQTWWSYPTTAYDTATVQHVADTFIAQMKAVIFHCEHVIDSGDDNSRMMSR